MPALYTPQGGYSPQATQFQGLQAQLASMPPLPPQAQQVANQAVQQGTQASQNLQQGVQNYQPAMQQRSQQLAGQAGFSQSTGAMDDLSKQYQLFLHDMQVANNQPVGTTAVPQSQPTATNPSQIGNPLAYGVQMGQSNPYAGLNYMYGAEGNALKNISDTLGQTSKFNLGEFQSQASQSSDALKTQLALYQDQSKTAVDTLNQLISAQQNQQQNQRDNLQTYISMVNAGLINPTGSDQTSQAQTLINQVQQGNLDPATATSIASGNPLLKKTYDNLAATQGLGLGGKGYTSATYDQVKSLLQEMNNGEISQNDISPGFSFLGKKIGRGLRADAVLGVLSSITGQKDLGSLESQYLQGGSSLDSIKTLLQNWMNTNQQGGSTSSNTQGAWQ